MTPTRRLAKRLFDLALAVILAPILLTLMLVVLVTLMFTEGRPYFYAAERMKSLAATFGVIPLIQLAEAAIEGVPGDPAILRDINAAIDSFA